MEIPILIKNNMYLPKTVRAWQTVWNVICEVAYDNLYDIQEEIITRPTNLIIKESELVHDDREFVHTQIYNFRGPTNYYELTLDHVWKKFDGEPRINKTLRRLHVPRVLFEDLGVRQWFAYSFPRCKVTYWEE
jgi:hypothetical protein